jgi:hypothetical protein
VLDRRRTGVPDLPQQHGGHRIRTRADAANLLPPRLGRTDSYIA